ncbi:MAG TPA: SusC/RagA family TonB-linked outer membrane protein, partial [Segetibacter sp.]|nr:SusC/RagA family TonB-linked outer membrane protein [Segetibacter sp.]
MKSKTLPNRILLQGFITCVFFILSSFLTQTAMAQTVSGVVRSAADNQPMTGATVQVKGTQNSTATDAKGHYVLNGTSSSDSLSFSSVGFKNETVSIKGRKEVNIILQAEASALDQVVVVGYGTQRKSDLTGSVVRVSMDDKSMMANTNIFSALSGSTAGVNVQSLGGAGSEPSLGIRGQTSLSASDQPLIVLDGIIYNGSITDINVNDVESVDILKDASAAAVYGSRSANGVIIITTKRGKTEKPTVSFNGYRGFQNMTNNPMKVMDAEQYAIRLVDYYYEQDLYNWYKTKPTSSTGRPVRPDVTNRSVVAARLRSQEEKDNYMAGKSIDWVKEVLQPAPIQNYNVSFSGRSDRTTYFVSGSYTGEEGILKNDKFKRLTVRTNLESKVTNWFTIGLNSSYSYRDYSGLDASLSSARTASPLANNKIGSSKYDMYLTGEIYMPYPLNNLYVDNSDTRNSLFLVGTAKVTVPWIKGLTYDFNYSNTYSNRENNTFYPVSTPQGSSNKGLATKNPSQSRNWIINNIVTYQKKIGDHRINATLLYSRENSTSQSSTLSAQG